LSFDPRKNIGAPAHLHGAENLPSRSEKRTFAEQKASLMMVLAVWKLLAFSFAT